MATSTGDSDPKVTDVDFEELIELENEHNAVDLQVLRQSWKLSTPLFARRRALVSRIPHFWSLVFDEAPTEIDNFIQPTDGLLFANHLLHFDVERFELETEPRSIALTFEFSENPYFEDTKLEKKFYWRSGLDGWSGLVSEPVQIRWRSQKDITCGVTDATMTMWKRWLELGGLEKRKGFSIMADDAAYVTLKEKLEASDLSTHSFFTLFTYVSAHRYVTAEESREADEKEAKDRAEKSSGAAKIEDEADDEDVDDQDVMACPHGDDLVNVLVEELYSNAIKYFMSAHEQDSDENSEADFEDGEDDEDSGSASEHAGPPAKRHKKHKHGNGCSH